MIFTHKYAYTCTEGSAVGDDECDDDEQKNKLIFIFYRYVSSNERVSYSLTPEYIYFFSLFFLLFRFAVPFNGFKHIFRCAPYLSASLCVAWYGCLFLSLSHSWLHFLPPTPHLKMCYTLLCQNDSFVLCMLVGWLLLLLLLNFQLFCFISFFFSVLKRFSCSIQSFS